MVKAADTDCRPRFVVFSAHCDITMIVSDVDFHEMEEFHRNLSVSYFVNFTMHAFKL